MYVYKLSPPAPPVRTMFQFPNPRNRALPHGPKAARSCSPKQSKNHGAKCFGYKTLTPGRSKP